MLIFYFLFKHDILSLIRIEMLRNRLRGSSLLFSRKFINEHEFYLKSDFINKMYFYYINRGYITIFINEILSVFRSVFTVGFILFLYNCVDYSVFLIYVMIIVNYPIYWLERCLNYLGNVDVSQPFHLHCL